MRIARRIVPILCLALLATLSAAGSAAAATGPAISVRIIGTAGVQPHALSSFADGSAWYAGTITEVDGSAVAMIGTADPSEATSSFVAAGEDAISTVPGLAGDGWLVGVGGDLQHIGADGSAGELLTRASNGATSLTVGPNGRLWFVEPLGDWIDTLGTTGRRTTRRLPRVPWTGRHDGAPSFPITTGADGRLWFAGRTAIGAITTRGRVTWYRRARGAGAPRSIVAGPGRSVWILGQNGDVTRVRTNGRATRIARLPGHGVPLIAAGPLGRIWLARQKSELLGDLTAGGRLRTRRVPGMRLVALAGAGNRLWGLTKTQLVRVAVGSVGSVVAPPGQCGMPANAAIVASGSAISVGTLTGGSTRTWWICRRDVDRLQLLDQLRTDVGDGGATQSYGPFATNGSALAYALTTTKGTGSVRALLTVRNLATGKIESADTGELRTGAGTGAVDAIAVDRSGAAAWIQHSDHAEVRVFAKGVRRTVASGPTGSLTAVGIGAGVVTWQQNGVPQSAPVIAP